MESVIEALEQIEQMLLQQQTQINRLASDLNSLTKLVITLTRAVEQKQQNGSEGKP